jgi:uncharacterized protein
MGVYVDTSALIKRYVHERTSHDFEVFLGTESEDLVISPLGLTEFESMLNRRLRRREFDHDFLERSRDLLGRDIEGGIWSIQAFDANVIPHATRLIREIDLPLATLDAIHLASAQAFGCDRMATGDRQLARAAEHCGLTVHEFVD